MNFINYVYVSGCRQISSRRCDNIQSGNDFFYLNSEYFYKSLLEVEGNLKFALYLGTGG